MAIGYTLNPRMSEFRQDITSGDWVIIAPGRAKRPDQLVAKKPARKPAPKATCPFELENLSKSDSQWPPLFPATVDAKTDIIVVPNKYPALSRMDGRTENESRGFYQQRRVSESMN